MKIHSGILYIYIYYNYTHITIIVLTKQLLIILLSKNPYIKGKYWMINTVQLDGNYWYYHPVIYQMQTEYKSMRYLINRYYL